MPEVTHKQQLDAYRAVIVRDPLDGIALHHLMVNPLLDRYQALAASEGFTQNSIINHGEWTDITVDGLRISVDGLWNSFRQKMAENGLLVEPCLDIDLNPSWKDFKLYQAREASASHS